MLYQIEEKDQSLALPSTPFPRSLSESTHRVSGCVLELEGTGDRKLRLTLRDETGSLDVLAMASRQPADDWQCRYNYRPLLLESFVQERFKGASYKAAGWVQVGGDQGRGKKDIYHLKGLPVKSVWLKQLARDFRCHLLEAAARARSQASLSSLQSNGSR